ncbi:MAG TPA: 6-bladed beta-propeller [Pyrinomonadaceae bacterium]|nr:6-bladed beta-propeller [Pyrinomonadaceae bacterium]
MESFSCPECGASLQTLQAAGTTLKCAYCGSTVIAPESIRPHAPQPVLVKKTSSKPLIIIFSLIGLFILLMFAIPLISTFLIMRGVQRTVSSIMPPSFRTTPSTRTTPTPGVAKAGTNVLLSFGGEGTGDGLFKRAGAIAVDSFGNIFVADDSLRIQKFDSQGKLLSVWRIPTETRNHTRLHDGPTRLVADRAGNVYAVIAGTFMKFDGASGALIGEEQGGEDVEDSVLMSDGSYMLVSSRSDDDDLVHLDSRGRLLKRTHKFASTVLGKSVPPQAFRLAVDGAGNTFALYALGALYGMHYYDSEDIAVYEFTPDGRFTGKFGSSGHSPGQFNMPNAIAVDNQSRIYVSDSSSYEIQIFAADGRLLKTIKAPHSVDAMAFDAANNLFVLSRNKVSKLSVE